VLYLSAEDEVSSLFKQLQNDSRPFKESIAVLGDLIFESETRELTFRSGVLKLFFSKVRMASFEDLKVALWKMEALSDIDSARREFSKLNGYSSIFKAFFTFPPSHDLAVPAWKLLTKGPEILDSIAKEIPDVLTRLNNQIDVNPNSVCSAFLSGIILILSGRFPSEKSHLNTAQRVITGFLRKKDPYSQKLAINCLIEAAAVDLSRPVILALGAKSAVEPFLKDPGTPQGFLSCLLLALLAASDISDTSDSGSEPTPLKAIDQVLKLFSSFSEKAVREVELTEHFVVFCVTILVAIRSLATNEENLKVLKERSIVSQVTTFFNRRKKDMQENSLSILKEVVKVVWTLAFDDECRIEFRETGMVGILQSLKGIKELQKEVDGALWTITGKRLSASSYSSYSGHIMLSYSSVQKERMAELGSYLKGLGFPIWLDLDHPEVGNLEGMTEVIEEAAAVIVGLSSSYKESQACRTEAEFAIRVQKDVLFVLAEDDFVPKGWLGTLIGERVCHNPWCHPAGFITGARGLVEELSAVSRVPFPEIYLPPSPSLPSSPTNQDHPLSPPLPPAPAARSPRRREKLEGVAAWGTEEVCDWLAANQMESLIPIFVREKIDGLGLLCWHRLDEGTFLGVWRDLGMEAGPAFRLKGLLKRLLEQEVREWGSEEVGQWLSWKGQGQGLEGLEGLEAAFAEGRWDGRVLLGLAEARRTPSFPFYCDQLGIHGPVLQLTLMSLLSEISP